jgi:VWFA-related protein
VRTLWSALLAVLCAAVLRAQPAPDSFTLDLIVEGVRSSGGAVLTPRDFTVQQDGVALRVESIRLIEPAAGVAAAPGPEASDERAVAASASRLVGIFVDEYHLSNDAAFANVKAAVAGFVRTALGPGDAVLVVKPLDSLVGLRLSTDREAAAASIESAEGRQGDYSPRSEFERQFIASAPARVDAARNRIALSAISAMATHLGRFEAGRKTLLIVSDGIGPAGEPRGAGVMPGAGSIVRAANRDHVAIYALRASSAPPADAAGDANGGSPRDALSTLASETTGLVFSRPDRAAADLAQVAREAGRYYLLTVAAPGESDAARYQAVSVSTSGPGLTVRAREGYGRRPDPEAARASVRTPGLPPGLRVPRRTSPMIRTWFGQSAATDGTTLVEFVWEPAVPVPGGRRSATAVPARVSVRVSTLEGEEIFSGEAGPSGRDSGFGTPDTSHLAFSVKPGPLLVQMELMDISGQVIDRDVRDLAVGGFPGPLAFGTAAVFRARTAPEFRAIAGSADASPVAARRFSRTEHLVVRVPLANSGPEATVTAQLESRFGSTLRDLRPMPAPDSPNVYQVDLPLASLASGGYALEFSARSTAGSARDRVEFVVTP